MKPIKFSVNGKTVEAMVEPRTHLARGLAGTLRDHVDAPEVGGQQVHNTIGFARTKRP